MSYGITGLAFWHGGVVNTPSTRRLHRPQGLEVFSRVPLSTDSIGNYVLTLTNLVIGSAVQIETQAGVLIENRTADASTEVFTVPAYTAGSANNNLRIKVRKGSSAPYYKPYETLATALVGAGSIYLSQIPD